MSLKQSLQELTVPVVESARLSSEWTTDLYQAVTTVVLLVAQVVLLVLALAVVLVLLPGLVTIQALALALRYMQK